MRVLIIGVDGASETWQTSRRSLHTSFKVYSTSTLMECFAKSIADYRDYKKVVYELVRKLKSCAPNVRVLTKAEAYNDINVSDYLPDVAITPADDVTQCIDPSISLRDMMESRMYVERVCGEHVYIDYLTDQGPLTLRLVQLRSSFGS